MMEWFLELAESYFGDEVEAALFVEEEVYSPELL